MAPRGEILDSDDEDYDLSPVQSPAAGPQNGVEDEEAARDRRAESTDPSFFRKVYDEQHVAASAEKSSSSVAAALSTDMGSTFSPNPPLNLSHGRPDGQYETSSITDPVPASRRRQKMSDTKEAVDLTQVTTPGRPTPGVASDIWDFPASQDDGNGAADSSVTRTASTKKVTIKLKVTDSKRKKSTRSSSLQSPGQPSSAHVPALSISQAEQEGVGRFSEPRQKKRKLSSSGQAASNSQEVDLLVIPRSEDKAALNSSTTPSDGVNTSSIVVDSVKARSASLMVVPLPSLTASQRDEYKLVSLSSEHEGQDQATHDVELDELQKSSGDATIKYPTPSGYGSSGRGLNPGDFETASSSRPRRRRQVADYDPPSSPDIISAPEVTPRDKRARSRPGTGQQDTYIQPCSPPLKSTGRRGQVNNMPDELTSPVAVITEHEPPRSSGRIKVPSRKRQEHDLTVPTTPATAYAETAVTPRKASERAHDEAQLPSTAKQRPERTKRGRKRKEVSNEAVVDDEQWETAPEQAETMLAAMAEEPVELIVEPAPKRRRGRPSKAAHSDAVAVEHEAFKPAADESAAMSHDQNETPKLKRKRGRPKKTDITQATQHEVLPDEQESRAHDDHEDEEQDATGVMGMRRNPNKTVVEEESSEPLSERDSNSNIGASLAKPTTLAKSDVADTAAKENNTAGTDTMKAASKDEKKPTTPSSQLGKVQYRVGLSKRSRIAPLLKSFRK